MDLFFWQNWKFSQKKKFVETNNPTLWKNSNNTEIVITDAENDRRSKDGEDYI